MSPRHHHHHHHHVGLCVSATQLEKHARQNSFIFLNFWGKHLNETHGHNYHHHHNISWLLRESLPIISRFDPPGLLEVHSGAALGLDDWPFWGQWVGFHKSEGHPTPTRSFCQRCFWRGPVIIYLTDHWFMSNMSYLEGPLYYRSLQLIYLKFRWLGCVYIYYGCGRWSWQDRWHGGAYHHILMVHVCYSKRYLKSNAL